MGACNATERRPHVDVSSGHKSYTPDQGVGEGIPPIPQLGKRPDGATENRPLHDGAILGIASAGAGEFISCGEDKTVRLHRLEEGYSGKFGNRATYTGHSKPAMRAVCGSNTERIYSCSRDATVRQWNLRRSRPHSPSSSATLRVFEGHTLACTAVALSADERTVCSGSRDTSLRLWDVETGACTASVSVPRNLVTCLKYLSVAPSSPSSTIVQGGEDMRLRVWDVREAGLRPALTIEGYKYFPLCIDVSADGFQVLTSSKGFNGVGCETKLWDLRTSSFVREYNGHTQDATACAFLPEGGVLRRGDGGSANMIVTASKDETIKIYDRANGKIVVDHIDPGCGGYTGLAVELDSQSLCIVMYASTITGGLYALRLEGVDNGEKGMRLRCVGFVEGSAIS